MANAQKRVVGEFNKMSKMNENWFKLSTYGDDIYQWKVIISGPEGSPYEGGKFECKVTLPKEYPHKPPKFQVVTKCYSFIINEEDHTICAPILAMEGEGHWTPTNNVHQVCMVFRTMLGDLDSEHVMNAELHKQSKENRNAYIKTAKEWTAKYAK